MTRLYRWLKRVLGLYENRRRYRRIPYLYGSMRAFNLKPGRLE